MYRSHCATHSGFPSERYEYVLRLVDSVGCADHALNPAFIDMLNELRLGKASDATVAAFRRLNEERSYGDGMEPTEL